MTECIITPQQEGGGGTRSHWGGATEYVDIRDCEREAGTVLSLVADPSVAGDGGPLNYEESALWRCHPFSKGSFSALQAVGL